MRYQNFHEYMETKNKQNKVIDNDKTGDHVVKGKGKGPGSDGSKAPKGCKVSGKGFADMGDKDLVVKFDKDGNTTKKGKSTMKVAESFAKYELLPLIRETIEANPLMTEDIVRELKRNGMLAVLVGELLEHKETYQHIASVMAHDEYGPAVCRKLVRAMREEADVAYHSAGKEEEEGPDVDDDTEESEDDFINKDPGNNDNEGVDDEDDAELTNQDPDNPDDVMMQGDGSDRSSEADPAQAAPANPAMANMMRAMGKY
jgi:hypothetical protein